MKRKLYQQDDSIYGAPALESTLLIETGGLDDTNQIGTLPSTNISASVSSGTKLFQYNRYFWNDEQFVFNNFNCGIGIAISHWNADGDSSFIIYPIFLPKVAMTLLQNLGSSPSDDPPSRWKVLKHLVYYLNLGFTSYGLGNTFDISFGPPTIRNAPVIYAKDCKGIPTPTTINNLYCPIFQDGANQPPLVWEISSSNGQLALIRNPLYWTPEKLLTSDIAYQIISLEEYMADSPQISIFGSIVPMATFLGTVNVVAKPYFGPTKGWCSQGAFATGFAQRTTYSDESFEYGDIYSSSQRRALWNSTYFPTLGPGPISKPTWNIMVKQHQLNRSFAVIANFITSLIPARYFAIESDALTRNQKRPVVSNNPYLAPSTMAIQFNTLDTKRTWTDDTIAGSSNSAGSILFGTRKSGLDDCAIVSFDPMQSLQTIDLTLRDEWGNILQNFMQLNSLQKSQNPFPVGPLGPNTQDQMIMGYFEGLYLSPGTFPIPAWVAPYNPSTEGGNQESILLNESWWTNWYPMFFRNPFVTTPTTFTIDEEFNPQLPRSTTMSHFGRVMGY
jgi:hypothetical protein